MRVLVVEDNHVRPDRIPSGCRATQIRGLGSEIDSDDGLRHRGMSPHQVPAFEHEKLAAAASMPAPWSARTAPESWQCPERRISCECVVRRSHTSLRALPKCVPASWVQHASASPLSGHSITAPTAGQQFSLPRRRGTDCAGARRSRASRRRVSPAEPARPSLAVVFRVRAAVCAGRGGPGGAGGQRGPQPERAHAVRSGLDGALAW